MNVANGNNLNVLNFNAINNPNLTCIQVDDAAYSTTTWTNIDATASFSENCALSINENEQLVNEGKPAIDSVSVTTLMGSSAFYGDQSMYEAYKEFGNLLHEVFEVAQNTALEQGKKISGVFNKEMFKKKANLFI